ncbi:hypothetical protein NCS52_01576100 [Fusarium sp. LHS14.1]|nr:hypothetical protein NCS52_01576100 [Fusarium sp. LHS14.1]
MIDTQLPQEVNEAIHNASFALKPLSAMDWTALAGSDDSVTFQLERAPADEEEEEDEDDEEPPLFEPLQQTPSPGRDAFIVAGYRLISFIAAQGGEPDLNDYGQPVIHTIARILDCIRLSSDIDLPLHGVFPDNEVSMVELALQLEEQQKEEVPEKEATEADSSVSNRTERASPSELDHSDVECDYPMAVSENATTLSAQDFTGNNCDATFDPLSLEMDDLAWFLSQSSSTSNYFPWLMVAKVEPGDLALQSLQDLDVVGRMNMVGKGLLNPASNIILTPNDVSNLGTVMNTGELMMYPGHDGEPSQYRIRLMI